MGNNIDKIENILDDFNDGVIDNIVDDNTLVFTAQDAEAARKARLERAEESKKRSLVAKKAAQDLVDSAKDLYSKYSGDIDYVKFKANANANSLGKILYQIEITEDAISTVMDSIQEGDTNPNLYRSLTDLQKTMMELLKTKNLYLSTIEDSFKQLTNDVEMSSAVEIEALDEENPTTAISKNGRELMKLINDTANRIEEEKKQKEDNANPEETESENNTEETGSQDQDA